MPAARRSLALTLALGCGPAVPTAASDTSGGGDDPGVRPEGPGAMYAACSTVRECAPLEFCVFPTREGGYCASSCAAPDDPSPCSAAPGDGAEVSCLDIGLPDGRWVCGLDCSAGACPAGMRCEAIGTPDGARDICF